MGLEPLRPPCKYNLSDALHKESDVISANKLQ